MAEYELRFKIFCQAQALAESAYQVEYSTVAMWNEDSKNLVKKDTQGIPSYSKIVELAEKINAFVTFQ